MARFARFGRAINEFAEQVKVNPLVSTFKSEGTWAGIKAGGRAAAEGYTNAGIHFTKGVAMDSSVGNQLRLARQAFGGELAVGLGGVAAGAGLGAWQGRRDGHTTARMLAYSALGGKIGGSMGSLYTFRKFASEENALRQFARAPMAAWRASAKAV